MSDDNRQTRPTEMHKACCHPARPSRRGLLAAGAALGVTGELLPGQAVAAGATATLDRLKRAERDPAHRTLLKGGIVLSLDTKLGDFDTGDVLIEGKKILAVGRNLEAPAALVVDARGMIVMPGFVDTHHHQYETILRGILADGVLGTPNDGKKTYQGVIQGIFTPVYQPDDAYISELVASLSQLNAGVTTTVDTSQVSHTPAHSDACIAGFAGIGTARRLHLFAGHRPGRAIPERPGAAAEAIFLIRRPAVDARAQRRPEWRQLGSCSASGRADHLPYRRRPHRQFRGDRQSRAYGPRQRIYPLHAAYRDALEDDRRDRG